MPLYYDEYKTSNAINSHLDQNEFQSDLDNLYTWSPQNLMEFDVKMCKLMRITKKRMPYLSDTKLNNNILEETSESCDVHVNTIANKAKKILSLARTCMIMILSYIYSRRQFAQVNDKKSELIDTKLGVAQGSTLGHVLCSMAKLFAFAEMWKHQRLRSNATPQLAVPLFTGTFQDSAAKLFNGLSCDINLETDLKPFQRKVFKLLKTKVQLRTN